MLKESQLQQKFDRAIDEVLSGKLDMGGFSAWLASTESYLQPKILAVRESCLDPTFEEGFPQAHESAVAGLGLFEEGLEDCFNYLETREMEHLHRARRNIAEGIAALQHSYDRTLDTSEDLTLDGRF